MKVEDYWTYILVSRARIKERFDAEGIPLCLTLLAGAVTRKIS
jgi:hypothetical protein